MNRNSTLLRWAVAALCVVAMVRPVLAQTLPNLVEEVSSTYNNIYVYREGPNMVLTFGHNRRFYTETIYDTTDDKKLPVTYTRFMTAALAYTGASSEILEIGSGGGRTAWYLHRYFPETNITTVELDPAVYKVAKKYFGIVPNDKFRIEVADGRQFLFKSSGNYDVIMIDAYRGPFVPFHLLTKEFFALVKSKLKRGGVAVQNIEPSTMIFDAAVATIQSIFDNVDIYEAGGNIVCVAYDGPRKTQTDLTTRANVLQDTRRLLYPINGMIQARRVTKQIVARVLTDDFAPVESLLAMEKHNRKWDDMTQVPPK